MSPARLRRRALEVAADPVESAREAGLRYVNPHDPGIRRIRQGNGFRYADSSGRVVRGAATLARIRSLAVPPAWNDVWICPRADGHVQAVGRDARRRRQYRYHPRWRATRDETKYNRMLAFAAALPKIRERVCHDLAAPRLPREKILATVVRLLEATLIRVGNDEYARANGSYGLTTLHDRHVTVRGATLAFHFRGKGGKEHAIAINDRRLARIVQRCQELAGQELFQYVDDTGARQSIDSADVNAYLREITGQDFTAKDFRTWAGTVLTAVALRELADVAPAAQARRALKRAIEAVAGMLGNTPTICRKSYIHPAITDAFLAGAITSLLASRAERRAHGAAGLTPEEIAVVTLLERRLAHEARRGAATAA